MYQAIRLQIGDEWKTIEKKLVYNTEKELTLFIRIRYDGNGNSVVRYIVTKDGQETSYEKYDSAAGAYELLNMKG